MFHSFPNPIVLYVSLIEDLTAVLISWAKSEDKKLFQFSCFTIIVSVYV